MTVSGDGLLAFEWFQGDGSTTVFDIKFYFLSQDDLKFLVERSSGALEDVTPTQVTGEGDPNGGSFTVAVAPSVSERIGVFRDLALGQPTNVEAQEDIPPSAIQIALDRLAMVNIQQQNLIERTVQASPADHAIALTLPKASERADKGLFFDGNGEPVARSASELSIMAADINFATQVDAEAGVDTSKVMTPLRVAEAINALTSSKQLMRQYFATSGTFIVPDGVSQLKVTVAGAGSGSISYGTSATDNATSGGASSFSMGGTIITANGGVRPVRSSPALGPHHGTASGGDLNITGGGAPGGMGSTNSYGNSGYPGSSGGLAIKDLTVTPADSWTVTVGAGGSGVTYVAAAADAGSDGFVIVEWME